MYNEIFIYLDKKIPNGAFNDNTGDFDFNLLTDSTVNTGRTWIDGKIIYRKVYNLGSIEPDSDVQAAHEIDNLDTVVTINGILRAGWNYQYNLNDSNSTGGTFRVQDEYIMGHMNTYLADLYEGDPIFETYLILEYTTK